MGRKRAFSWRKRLVALLGLALIGAGGWLWWQGQHWAPSRAAFPQQGVLIGARDGEADFKALKAIGADFVYLAHLHPRDSAHRLGHPLDPLAVAGQLTRVAWRRDGPAGEPRGVLLEVDRGKIPKTSPTP